MNNKRRKVAWDFAAGKQVLAALSPADRGRVQEAIAGLAADHRPQEFSAREVGDNAWKIVVPVTDDEITVIYELDEEHATIDVIEVKRRGVIKRLLDQLKELANFSP